MYSFLQPFFDLPQLPFLFYGRFFFIEFYRMIYVIQFTLACAALRERFKKLNNLLKIVKLDVDGKEIVTVGQLYHKLCDAIEVLNESFTFHFITIFLNLIVC